MKKRLFCLALSLVMVLTMIPSVFAGGGSGDPGTPGGPKLSTLVFDPGEFGEVYSNLWAIEMGQPVGALPTPVNITLHNDGKFNNMYFEGWYEKGKPGELLDPSFVTTKEAHYLVASWTEGQGGDSFKDVKPTSWYADAVRLCSNMGLISGTSATTFSPKETVTRGQVVTILYRLAGEPKFYSSGKPFSDVGSGKYYTNGVLWCSQKGIVNGYPDGTFHPNDNVTREQLASFFSRFANLTGRRDGNAGIMLAGFTDEKSISSWARDDVSWAYGVGLIQGSTVGGRPYFKPKDSATRAEFAMILMRYIQMIDGSRTYYAGDYYSAIIPETWPGNVVCEHQVTSFGECLAFYAKPLYEEDGSGWLFTLGVCPYENLEYLNLPKFKFLYCLRDEEGLRANVFLMLPTDVQCEYPPSTPKGALYQSMFALREAFTIETVMGWYPSTGVG